MARTKNLNRKAKALNLKERRLKKQAHAIGLAGDMAMTMAAQIDQIKAEAYAQGYEAGQAKAYKDARLVVEHSRTIGAARKALVKKAETK